MTSRPSLQVPPDTSPHGSPSTGTGSDGTGSAGLDPSAAQDLLRRTNEFLALCVAQSESALETEDPAVLIAALRAIRDSAGSVAGAGESLRRELLEPED